MEVMAIMRCILVAAFFLAGSSAFAAEGVSTEYAEFSEDLLEKSPADFKVDNFGTMNLNLNAQGLIFKHRIADRTQIFVGGSFSADPNESRFRVFPGIAASRIREREQLIFLVGAERIFYTSNTNRVGFVIGGAIGYRQSRYEARLYPRFCNGICGYNLNLHENASAIDRFGFLAARTGFGWFDRRIMGQKMDLVVSLVPLLARWPDRIRLSTPTVADFDPVDGKQGLISFELLLRI